MWQRLAFPIFILLFMQTSAMFAASPIPASDLVEGRSYYLLTAEIGGIGDARNFQAQACPRSRGLLSFIWQNKIAFSIHVSYQFGSRAGLIEQKELPILIVTNDGNKCTINFALSEISPIFVPTQNLTPGRSVWTYPIKLKVAVKNDFESGFVNSLVSLASAAANFVGIKASILTALTEAPRVKAQTEITNFFSTQFDNEQVVELPQYTIDFRRPKKTISITNLKLSGGKKIPISLTLKLERRQSIISAQPAGVALKSVEFGEWTTKPVSFKADKTPVTGLDIKNDLVVVALKTSDQRNWNDNCEKVKSKLVNGQGLSHTDAAFILARVILDENAEISKFDSPVAKLMTCPGKLYIGEIARLGEDLAKLDENAEIVARKGREAKRQIVNKAVNDMARAWKQSNKELVADNLENYLAKEVSLEDTSLLLSPNTQFVSNDEPNARQTIISLLATLRLSEFGCFGVPPTIDYTAANIYAVLPPVNAGGEGRPALMTWTFNRENLNSKTKFVTSVTMRALDPSDEADKKLVQDEVLANKQCALVAKFNSFEQQVIARVQ